MDTCYPNLTCTICLDMHTGYLDMYLKILNFFTYLTGLAQNVDENSSIFRRFGHLKGEEFMTSSFKLSKSSREVVNESFTLITLF